MFCYDKLWIMLIKKHMTKGALQKLIGASPNTITAMGKGEPVSMNTIGRICEVMKCQPGDIVEYVSDDVRSENKS